MLCLSICYADIAMFDCFHYYLIDSISPIAVSAQPVRSIVISAAMISDQKRTPVLICHAGLRQGRTRFRVSDHCLWRLCESPSAMTTAVTTSGQHTGQHSLSCAKDHGLQFVTVFFSIRLMCSLKEPLFYNLFKP